MENKSFDKIINQHLSIEKNSEKANLNLEEMEEIAQEKMSRLFSDNFKTFGVRFVNISEYQKILETGKFDGEVYVYGEKGDLINYSFKEWFDSHFKEDKGGKSFDSMAREHTKWDTTSEPLGYRDIIASLVENSPKENRLKEIAQNLLKKRIPVIQFATNDYNPQEKEELEKELLENVSRETLEKAKNLWKSNENFRQSWGFTSFWSEVNEIKEDRPRILTPNSFDNLEEKLPVPRLAEKYFLKYDIELRFGEENLKIVHEFIQNPEEYISSQENRRKLYHAILYSPTEKTDQLSRPYHMLLIFDDKEFNFKPQGSFVSYQEWARFPHDKSQEIYYKGLLGAISLMPNKEINEKMLEIEKISISKDLSHPIFDSSGRVKWPKKDQK